MRTLIFGILGGLFVLALVTLGANEKQLWWLVGILVLFFILIFWYVLQRVK